MKRAFFTLLCVLLTIVTLLFVAFMVAVGAAHPAGFTWVDWSIIGGIVVFQMVFMLPSYVAIYWNQPQMGQIFLTNFWLVGSKTGWFAMLNWALHPEDLVGQAATGITGTTRY